MQFGPLIVDQGSTHHGYPVVEQFSCDLCGHQHQVRVGGSHRAQILRLQRLRLSIWEHESLLRKSTSSLEGYL